MGKMSIWVSLIPTFALISLSAGVMCILLLLEFMFNRMEADDEDPFGWDIDDEEDEKDS